MGKDGKLYQKNPTNQYISQFLDEFDNWLRCGSIQHVFKYCPRKVDKALRNIFWHEPWAHIPSTRKIPSPFFISLPRPPTQLTKSSFISQIYRSITGLQSQTNSSRSIVSPQSQTNPDTKKRPRFMEIFACVSNICSSPPKPIYILLIIIFPSNNFHLGLEFELENYM